MRGWHIIAVLIVLSVVVTATHNSNNTNTSSNSSTVPCTDTDGGGERRSDASALENKGDVKYGLSTQTDTCLTSDDGVSASTGKHLKEYFCRDSQRDSDVYNCLALGYKECSDGECVGATSTTSNQTQQQQPEVACGNHQVEKDKGEECDPPFKICFGKTSTQYGQCDVNCKCKIAGTAPTPSPLCGDGTRDSTEECESDSDCPTNHVCSSCKCAKQLTQAEIDAMKQQAATGKEDVTKDVSQKIDEQYKSPELPEVNLTAKNFSEEPGVKAASGIANFFKTIFGWIAGLFS